MRGEQFLEREAQFVVAHRVEQGVGVRGFAAVEVSDGLPGFTDRDVEPRFDVREAADPVVDDGERDGYVLVGVDALLTAITLGCIGGLRRASLLQLAVHLHGQAGSRSPPCRNRSRAIPCVISSSKRTCASASN